MSTRSTLDIAEEENAPDTTQASIECPTCFLRREKLQSIGVAIYFVSLFSCGTLLPFSLLAAIIIQSLSLRKCRACREAARSKRRERRKVNSLA